MDVLKIIPDRIFYQVLNLGITDIRAVKLSGPLHRTADLTAPQIQNLRLFLPCFLQKFHLYIAAREIGKLWCKTLCLSGKCLLAPGICHRMEGLSRFPVFRTLETKFLTAGSLHPKFKKESHILAKIIDLASVRLHCHRFSFIGPDDFQRSIKRRLRFSKLRTVFQKCSLRQLFFLFRRKQPVSVPFSAIKILRTVNIRISHRTFQDPPAFIRHYLFPGAVLILQCQANIYSQLVSKGLISFIHGVKIPSVLAFSIVPAISSLHGTGMFRPSFKRAVTSNVR